MATIEFIATHFTIYVILMVVLGLLVGSFLNVVVYRLPIMLKREWDRQCNEYLKLSHQGLEQSAEPAPLDKLSLATPGSHCPACRHRIRVWENLPVISYLLLRGRCSQCNTHISLRYPAVEILSGIIAGLLAWNFGMEWQALMLLILSWSLLTLALIDFEHQLLPDEVTLPLLWAGLLCNTFELGIGVTIQSAVIGAVAGYLTLWSFYWLFRLVSGKEGMGFGDFKLLAALGAWLGWQSLLPIIILSSLAGSVVGIAMIAAAGRDRSIPIPFGPFLAGAGMIMILWGPQLNAFYFDNFVG